MGEMPFSMIYGIESVILVEIGMLSFRTSNFDKKNNKIELRLNIDLLDKKREVTLCKGRSSHHYEVRFIYYTLIDLPIHSLALYSPWSDSHARGILSGLTCAGRPSSAEA